MGDSDAETLSNVTQGEFDFDDDSFEAISEDAKDFIDNLLLKDKRYFFICLFLLSGTLSLLVVTADNLYKQFGSRSGMT